MSADTRKAVRSASSVRKDVVLSILSILLLVTLLFPLYWIFATSLKTEQEIFRIPATLWPETINTASYAAQLEMGDFNMFHSFANAGCVVCKSFSPTAIILPQQYGQPFPFVLL